MTDTPSPARPTKLEAGAHDPAAGMDLAELIAFIQICERNDVPRDAKVKARLGWNGKIKVLTVGG